MLYRTIFLMKSLQQKSVRTHAAASHAELMSYKTQLCTGLHDYVYFAVFRTFMQFFAGKGFFPQFKEFLTFSTGFSTSLPAFFFCLPLF